MESENICTAGWLLDVYVSGLDEVTVWIKKRNGEAVSLKEKWMPRLYVAGPPSELKNLSSKFGEKYDAEFIRRFPGPKAINPKNVLSLNVPAQERSKIARLIVDLGGHRKYQVFNVDVPPGQEYLYQRSLFPLANVSATTTRKGIEWRLRDDIEASDYDISWIKTVKLSVYPKSRRKITSFDDPLDMITLRFDDEIFELNGTSEEEILLKLVSEIEHIDPDLLLTTYGDMFALPYLVHRSSVHGLDLEIGRDRGLRLGREASYFSYGKIYYRPQGVKLLGRLHVDASNAMLYNDSELDGLYEIARICRVPLQDVARYTIGNCMTSLQYYQAYSSGILIPWRVAPLGYRSLVDLRVADRGGWILDPLIGLHENVGELDFTSLFPNIMVKHNLSGETVNCSCCPNSTHLVPETGYWICQRRRGVVPKSIRIPLIKRAKYKQLIQETDDQELKTRYKNRVAALKWILVTCLPRESPVLVKGNGQIQYVKIGDFIDNLAGKRVGIIDCPTDVFVAGLSHDLKQRFCRVGRLVRVPYHGKFLSFTMDDGRKIVTTSDHPFFLLKDGELKVKPANEIKEGDPVPVSKKIKSLHRLLESDLGFVCVTEVKGLERNDEYVYCFQLDDSELPGFFTGEGAVYTHNCFGYLGFRKAKFGHRDAHMATCAFSRDVLRKTVDISERDGFRVVHGIVDSIWVWREGARDEDYEELGEKIQRLLDFPVSFEGKYRWIVFLPSRRSLGRPVLNRYYGVFSDGEIKMRGIETRRHDIPRLVRECQLSMIEELAKARDAAEFHRRIPLYECSEEVC